MGPSARRALAAGALVAVLGAVAGTAVVLNGDGDKAAPSRPRAEPDAATLRAATLAGPDGPRSEALRSGLSSLRCEVTYGAERRAVEVRLAYGGGGELLHFTDATLQIIYQDLEAYPPELFIGAATKPNGRDFLGRRLSPRLDATGLSPGDVVQEATVTHPDTGSTLTYSCSVR
jgi:hypothetical protein